MVLIANRGVIACRIIRTLRRLGIPSVAVYSDADRHSPHVRSADRAVRIGPAPATQSYLSIDAILDAARQTGAEAIHPGYGFLSENPAFAEACESAGIRFLGPTPGQMRAFGLKHTAREIASANGLPLLPGTELLLSADDAVRAAEWVGYPVMLKSTAGGGGIGMRVCRDDEALREAFEAVERLSRASFGSSGLYLEKFVERARHIEVQIFGDGAGDVVALGERDCSAQRRNQKVIEETPALGLSDEARARLFDAAVRLGRAVNYRSAGTVEFIYDADTAAFYFLEVNTRLQVEHGVTEEVLGIDLVEWMLRGASLRLATPAVLPALGHSIQVRLYAEDPAKNFQPSAGRLMHVRWPEGVRFETWVEPGTEVTPYYDPMIAKIIVHAGSRKAALQQLRDALDATELAGIETNLAYLRQVAAGAAFSQGAVTTSYLSTFTPERRAVDVLDPGTQTTVQDYPGRLGYWHVGVPPSGPMDSLAFRAANRLVGNPDSAAGIEIAVTGPTLRFAADTTVAVTGADFGATLDGAPVPRWTPIAVSAGSVLAMPGAPSAGARAYLAIAGGIDVPAYLGSKSTFILGKFGGHAGRTLRAGDVLHLGSPARAPRALTTPEEYAHEWNVGVLYGPHGAPDFFTPADIDMFFATAWKVHYNSDRTGTRLIGPKPVWARPDGGEAGLHPSNIHDNPYAVGTVDFTGDMPIVLGPDGPSLGGFVCPATVVDAELWKIGQLRPGDRVRFRPITEEQAIRLNRSVDDYLRGGPFPTALPHPHRDSTPILRSAPGVVCRADGDRYLLVEFGPNVLDLNLRFRVHALEEQLRRAGLPGIVDITPGVRSLHVHYDTRQIGRESLLDALDACERAIPDLDDLAVPSRIVHLPLSWDDPATQLAIRKYTQSVRPGAPWAPSNIEFIRRINGLASEDEVKRIVFDAGYLVLGLGDVYLGAPVATPADPRHRLVTTKYNPARTWTPENAVGIGGAYLCVYGLEGPGGYQFVGRTVQMWNTFGAGIPWLLRFFDQIRFYPVGAEELLEIREAFPHGGYPLQIEETAFKIRDYHAFLASIAPETADFKSRQQAAFDAERERWALNPYAPPPETDAAGDGPPDALPEGCRAVAAPVTASVWNIAVSPGQRVEAGQKLIVLEAMKMEIAVSAPSAGTVELLNCAPGALVSAGQRLVTLRQEV